ncbi:MAG TPA: NUDIX hydrolase [Acidocella sp.]|nr:NUDIX hydrolase [Acidocella sp.]
MPDFVKQIPEGDTHERDVCAHCGYVAYDNPKIVAGAVVAHAGKVLLCRRAIEPRAGFWTLPAGFLEAHEQPEDGARREALEEAMARITLEGLIGIYTVRHISQVQMFFRARFEGPPDFRAGHETLEARLFAWEEIPWPEIAFPSVIWTLQTWHTGEDGMRDIERFSVKA